MRRGPKGHLANCQFCESIIQCNQEHDKRDQLVEAIEMAYNHITQTREREKLLGHLLKRDHIRARFQDDYTNGGRKDRDPMERIETDLTRG